MTDLAAGLAERLKSLHSPGGDLPTCAIFGLAKDCAQTPPAEIEKLLDPDRHEERVTSASIV